MKTTGKPRGKPFKPGTKPGPGRPPGALNKTTREARDIAQGLLEDKAYADNLRTRLRRGKLAPAVEQMLWFYAYGKPSDNVNIAGLPAAFTLLIGDAATNDRDD